MNLTVIGYGFVGKALHSMLEIALRMVRLKITLCFICAKIEVLTSIQINTTMLN